MSNQEIDKKDTFLFASQDEEIGSLIWEDGVFKFKGEAEESAKIFLNWLNKLKND